MTTPRAIKATFSNWRPVMGRKVLQLIFEVPIEQQGEVLTMLGMPDEKWCAIALLNSKPEPDATPAGAVVAARSGVTAGETAPKPKRAFKDLSLPEQAGIRANDMDFRLWLVKDSHPMTQFPSPERAAEYIRSYCGVDSRSEFATSPAAANLWCKLNAEFEAWKTDQKYAEVRR